MSLAAIKQSPRTTARTDQTATKKPAAKQPAKTRNTQAKRTRKSG